jgi:hypothetical protein
MLTIYLYNQLFFNICYYDIMALITCLLNSYVIIWQHGRRDFFLIFNKIRYLELEY